MQPVTEYAEMMRKLYFPADVSQQGAREYALNCPVRRD
jgi:hypothetical protein